MSVVVLAVVKKQEGPNNERTIAITEGTTVRHYLSKASSIRAKK